MRRIRIISRHYCTLQVFQSALEGQTRGAYHSPFGHFLSLPLLPQKAKIQQFDINKRSFPTAIPELVQHSESAISTVLTLLKLLTLSSYGDDQESIYGVTGALGRMKASTVMERGILGILRAPAVSDLQHPDDQERQKKHAHG